MIVITTTDTQITVTGHAGHGPPGQDIVCAAVSTLVQTLAGALEQLTPDTADCTLEPGNTEIQLHSPSAKARLLMNAFCIGAKAIAEEYPNYVKII